MRGERWVVDEATVFADTTVLTLSSPARASAPRRCRLLAPFDRPFITSRSRRIRGVTRRRWMHHLHAELSTTSRIRRVARSSAGRHRHSSLSVGAGARAGPRSRVPIPARGRGRARQDDPGRPHVVGVARARMVRTGAYRDARGTSPAVGRGAAAAIRDTRDRRGRVSPRGTRRIAPLRRESVVGRTGRHHVHRLSEAARSAARGRRSVVGCVDCGRGAPGHSRVAAIRRDQRSRITLPARAAAHGHSARRRQSRVSSAVRHRTTRPRTTPSCSSAGRGA